MLIENRTRLGRWLGAVVLAATLSGAALAPALAQEIGPEQLALARKYVDLTNKTQIYEVILVQTASQTSKLLTQQNPDLADKINAAIGKILESYKGKNDDLFNQFARVYASNFTTEELQQIVDFYSTPTGQKLATQGFDNNQAMQKIMQVYTYNLGTEFVTKVKNELKAEGITP